MSHHHHGTSATIPLEGRDDCAIFVEDTLDPSTARRVASSAAGIAMLSPQRKQFPLPPDNHHHITEDLFLVGGSSFPAAQKSLASEFSSPGAAKFLPRQEEEKHQDTTTTDQQLQQLDPINLSSSSSSSSASSSSSSAAMATTSAFFGSGSNTTRTGPVKRALSLPSVISATSSSTTTPIRQQITTSSARKMSFSSSSSSSASSSVTGVMGPLPLFKPRGVQQQAEETKNDEQGSKPAANTEAEETEETNGNNNNKVGSPPARKPIVFPRRMFGADRTNITSTPTAAAAKKKPMLDESSSAQKRFMSLSCDNIHEKINGKQSTGAPDTNNNTISGGGGGPPTLRGISSSPHLRAMPSPNDKSILTSTFRCPKCHGVKQPLRVSPSPARNSITTTTASIATSPFPSKNTPEKEAQNKFEAPKGFVLISEEDLRRKDDEIRRLDRQYHFQKQDAKKANKEAEEERAKCQEKIQTIVGLSARLEESKRYIRQIKKETLETRQRTLSLYNDNLKKGGGSGNKNGSRGVETLSKSELDKIEDSIKLKYAKILRGQEDEFSRLFGEQQDRIDALEDIIAASEVPGVGSAQTMLVSAFSRNNDLSRRLTDLEARYETTSTRLREVKQEVKTIRERAFEAEEESLKVHSQSSKNAHKDRVAIDELQAEVLNVRAELTATQEEMEFYRENLFRMSQAKEDEDRRRRLSNQRDHQEENDQEEEDNTDGEGRGAWFMDDDDDEENTQDVEKDNTAGGEKKQDVALERTTTGSQNHQDNNNQDDDDDDEEMLRVLEGCEEVRRLDALIEGEEGQEGDEAEEEEER